MNRHTLRQRSSCAFTAALKSVDVCKSLSSREASARLYSEPDEERHYGDQFVGVGVSATPCVCRKGFAHGRISSKASILVQRLRMSSSAAFSGARFACNTSSEEATLCAMPASAADSSGA